jgi:DNA-binding transcriptional LysR family regulator
MPADPGRRARSFIHLQRVADPLRLRLLIEVGARGSISAAAEACSIGQPSASLHLRHLEAAVGSPLVKRGTTGSRLTPEGEIVRLHATRMLAALDAMLDELNARQVGTRGTLSVATSTAASYLLPTALRRFGERHPEVDVTVLVENSAGVQRLVRRREVALGIAGPVPSTAGVECEHLLDDEVVGIAAPGLIDPPGPTVSLAALAPHTLLVRHSGSGQQLAAARVLDDQPQVPELKTRVLDSEETVKRMVRQGLGVAFLSRLAIRDEVARGEVVTFRLADRPPMTHPLHMARPADVPVTVVQRAFVHAIEDAWRIEGRKLTTATRRFTGSVARLPAPSAPTRSEAALPADRRAR